MGKWEVIGNAELCPNYFSVKVSVLAVVFYQQFSKIQQLQAKLLVFLNLLMKYNSYYESVYRKIIRT